MNENEKSYYFSAIKILCVMLLIVYFVSNSRKSLHEISVEWFLLCVTLAAILGYELVSKKNRKVLFLCLELTLTIVQLFLFHDNYNGLFLIPMVVLDAIICFHLSFSYSFLVFIGIFFSDENFYLYLIYCIFILIIYFQHFVMIEKYRGYLKDSIQEEYKLKDSINTQDTRYKEQLAKSSLAFENNVLEEKARLSQALHDKLGHSINGTIYQLEACKVLLEKDIDQSKKIIQVVIDNLRTSMDEIRLILRKEKPDKKRMAYLQLVQLCEECKEKYGIQADFDIDGEDKEISELIWEVILDNSIEAVTNALKYSKCSKLTIEIKIMHKLVRCTIWDNGIGCSSLKEGMGIQGMKNRARKVNGSIDINSDNGFRINILIPLTVEPSGI